MLPVFKTGERRVHPVSGVFDSHTLPPFRLYRLFPVCIQFRDVLGTASFPGDSKTVLESSCLA